MLGRPGGFRRDQLDTERIFASRLVISFCRANRSPVSLSNRSAHRCASVAASISWALTRSWLPDRLTLPSSTYRTPNSRLICFVSTGLFRYANAVFREITNIFEILDKSVVRSSVIPSAKYCCSRSSLRLVKGSTTIDRRGAVVGGALDGVDDILAGATLAMSP